MNALLDLLKQNVGFLVGCGGVILSIVFFLRTRRNALPRCAITNIPLLDTNTRHIPEGVELTYLGKPIERLTRTLVYFWNAGNATLEGSAIAEADPPRIACEHAQENSIADAGIVAATREAINARLGDDSAGSLASIEFDFLDPGDGLAVEIYHDLPPAELQITGALRGHPRWLSDVTTAPMATPAPPKPRFSQVVRAGVELIMVAALPIAMLNAAGQLRHVWLLAVGVVLGLLGTFLQNRRRLRNMIPSALTKTSSPDIKHLTIGVNGAD